MLEVPPKWGIFQWSVFVDVFLFWVFWFLDTNWFQKFRTFPWWNPMCISDFFWAVNVRLWTTAPTGPPVQRLGYPRGYTRRHRHRVSLFNSPKHKIWRSHTEKYEHPKASVKKIMELGFYTQYIILPMEVDDEIKGKQTMEEFSGNTAGRKWVANICYSTLFLEAVHI